MASEHTEKKNYGLMYYIKGAASGGICCSVTHAAMCPVDVVKTRIQLEPTKYTTGLVGTFRRVVAEEGMGALSTGLGATAAGYFVQGWFKFGGVEFFKIKFANALGVQRAWDNRTSIYLASSAMAEFIADLFLCPLEAIRIKSVSNPAFPKGVSSGISHVVSNEGVLGLYAGLGPILFKQVPYTMAKFAVQGKTAEAIYTATNSTPATNSKSSNVGISLASGVIAGVAAAIVSHPADTLLSMINKAGGDKSGSVSQQLWRLARETGFKKLCTTGLAPRCVMIGTLTAGQFGIFDSVMNLLGASKFHFHDPSSDVHH
jgi:solute carrier family 25 phosphate transporter 3